MINTIKKRLGIGNAMEDKIKRAELLIKANGLHGSNMQLYAIYEPELGEIKIVSNLHNVDMEKDFVSLLSEHVHLKETTITTEQIGHA